MDRKGTREKIIAMLDSPSGQYYRAYVQEEENNMSDESNKEAKIDFNVDLQSLSDSALENMLENVINTLDTTSAKCYVEDLIDHMSRKRKPEVKQDNQARQDVQKRQRLIDTNKNEQENATKTEFEKRLFNAHPAKLYMYFKVKLYLEEGQTPPVDDSDIQTLLLMIETLVRRPIVTQQDSDMKLTPSDLVALQEKDSEKQLTSMQEELAVLLSLCDHTFNPQYIFYKIKEAYFDKHKFLFNLYPPYTRSNNNAAERLIAEPFEQYNLNIIQYALSAIETFRNFMEYVQGKLSGLTPPSLTPPAPAQAPAPELRIPPMINFNYNRPLNTTTMFPSQFTDEQILFFLTPEHAAKMLSFEWLNGSWATHEDFKKIVGLYTRQANSDIDSIAYYSFLLLNEIYIQMFQTHPDEHDKFFQTMVFIDTMRWAYVFQKLCTELALTGMTEQTKKEVLRDWLTSVHHCGLKESGEVGVYWNNKLFHDTPRWSRFFDIYRGVYNNGDGSEDAFSKLRDHAGNVRTKAVTIQKKYADYLETWKSRWVLKYDDKKKRLYGPHEGTVELCMERLGVKPQYLQVKHDAYYTELEIESKSRLVSGPESESETETETESESESDSTSKVPKWADESTYLQYRQDTGWYANFDQYEQNQPTEPDLDF